MNAERADDVVTHQRLLQEARDPERRPALSVRVVQVTDPSLLSTPPIGIGSTAITRMHASRTRVDVIIDLCFVHKSMHRFLLS